MLKELKQIIKEKLPAAQREAIEELISEYKLMKDELKNNTYVKEQNELLNNEINKLKLKLDKGEMLIRHNEKEKILLAEEKATLKEEKEKYMYEKRIFELEQKLLSERMIADNFEKMFSIVFKNPVSKETKIKEIFGNVGYDNNGSSYYHPTPGTSDIDTTIKEIE